MKIKNWNELNCYGWITSFILGLIIVCCSNNLFAVERLIVSNENIKGRTKTQTQTKMKIALD